MIYRLPLRERQRYARNKRDRYYRDPEYRLAQINASRSRKGLPPYDTLEQVPLRREA
jgi:hypothetical protein